MKAALITVTLIELGLLVIVLAAYLIAIAATLRKISSTLGLITFGVRAIEKQTEPLGPVLRNINEGLEQIAAALGLLVVALVVALFDRIVRPALEIKRYAADILESGVGIARNLDGVDEAVRTRDLATAVPGLATAYLKKLGAA